MSTSTKPFPGTKGKWLKRILLILLALLLLAGVVFVAKWSRNLPTIQSFLTTYPGESHLADGTPVGFPVWLSWQHFLNSFFILLIIRSGWQIRTVTKPVAFWTRNNNGIVRTRKAPKKISLNLWFHLSLDTLWVLNGIIFYVLIFSTGQWKRIVPTNWDIFPNALSAALQYASLNWPVDNGWINYNSLQVISYFTTVFIAAPLAVITGLRMSGAWPQDAVKLNKVYPIEAARILHLPVMVYFVFFIFVHVTLVFATGALRNLNHMYANNNDGSWLGFFIFAGSLIIMISAWFLARPLFMRPVASLMGSVTR
jgi:thiosulfate reductase cytochrome b subunit